MWVSVSVGGGGTGWGGGRRVWGVGGCPDTWRAAFSSSSHLIWFRPIWRPYKILTTFRGLWQLRCPWVCRFCWWRKEIRSRVAVWNLRKGKKERKKKKNRAGKTWKSCRALYAATSGQSVNEQKVLGDRLVNKWPSVSYSPCRAYTPPLFCHLPRG